MYIRSIIFSMLLSLFFALQFDYCQWNRPVGLTPGIEGAGNSQIVACMALYALFPLLIDMNMNNFRIKYHMTHPRSRGCI